MIKEAFPAAGTLEAMEGGPMTGTAKVLEKIVFLKNLCQIVKTNLDMSYGLWLSQGKVPCLETM